MRRILNVIKPCRKSLTGISLLALCLSGPALAQTAQDSVYVDISDPNVSIDLSVLDDGGRGPAPGMIPNRGVNTAVSQNTYGAGATLQNRLQQFSHAGMPVSTLYIQPSKSLNIPPQTKPLLVLRAPGSSPVQKVAAPAQKKAVKVVAAPTPPSTPPSTPTAPPAPPALKTPVVQPKPVAEVVKPVEAAKPVKAPVAKVVAVEVPKAASKVVVKTPTPAPALKVVKVEPVAPPTPLPLSKPETAVKVPDVAMPAPPPPRAVAKVAPPTPVVENETIVDLPPQSSQPGVASLPSATGDLSDGDNMRIVFAMDSSKLPQDARDALKALSDKLKGQDSLRLQLLAYAGNADMSASAARRLSLSRALAVRSHLIENGVRSTRIDVRALGNKSSDEVTERVDITVVER
ncbi:MAG: hypothetical protein COB59_09170 [Rhodospirillaceae bacterium]|nr:MAG: hypothetical protein COB59_09170 [Rhodospirillaceae bacterium]